MELERVKLGQTGLDVNRICLGGGSFGGSTPLGQVTTQLDHWRSIGGIFIDTAVMYCDWLIGIEPSSSMHILGRWMKHHGCRKELTISAKGCDAKIIRPTGINNTCPKEEPNLRRDGIISEIERSMEYLQTDYLDIFTLHADNESVEVGEILETLESQVKRGVIRAYGCSNWRIDRQRAAYEYAKTHGLTGFLVDQISWCLNLYSENSFVRKRDAHMDDRAYALHRETGIPAMAYGANGRAYFHRLANNMPIPDSEHTEYRCATNDAILEVLKEAAAATGVEVNTIVINYLLWEHGFQVIPIIGIKTIRELEIALAALDFTLPEEYKKRILELRPL